MADITNVGTLVMTERTHLPPISSPLNPDSCCAVPLKRGRTVTARLIQHQPARTAVSPTQRLLRKKAAVAWRSEVLRRALVAAVPPSKKTLQFQTVNPNETQCQVHILSTDPLELEGGDLGLTIEDFAPLDNLPKQPMPMTQSEKAFLSGRKVFELPKLAAPESDLQEHRRATGIATRRIMAAIALVCLLAVIHALNFVLDITWRLPISP